MTRLAWLAVLAALIPSSRAAEPLPRSRPEAQGVAPRAVLEFIEAADREIDSFHSVMLVRHGHVVAEGWWTPYNLASRHELYSLSKSFTSTAVGLAVAEGKLSVDDPVLKFFPDDAPDEPGAQLKSMRVSDLLRMSTGQQTEPPRPPDASWARAFLAHPVPFKPGTHFLYNTSATYMLSAIVQKATGETVLDYLRPRLFDPIGIADPTWGASPQGVTLGGYGLSVRTEDIAKFGQLYLQKGRWQGKSIVPELWVDAATARQTSNGSNPASDWDQGYGYQFWRSRHGAYRGDGAFGQYCIVLPEQDAVVAITSGVKDMQAVLNLVWDRLLPALQPSPLPADDEARQALERKLAGLVLRPQEGSATSPVAEKVAGTRYLFPPEARPLESITLGRGGPDGAPLSLVIRNGGSDYTIAGGPGQWRNGRLALGSHPEQPQAASLAWTDDETLAAKVCLYETPFTVILRLKFTDGKLLLDAESNVGFGPTRQPQRIGTPE